MKKPDKGNESEILPNTLNTRIVQKIDKIESAITEYPVKGLRGDVNSDFYEFLALPRQKKLKPLIPQPSYIIHHTSALSHHTSALSPQPSSLIPKASASYCLIFCCKDTTFCRYRQENARKLICLQEIVFYAFLFRRACSLKDGFWSRQENGGSLLTGRFLTRTEQSTKCKKLSKRVFSVLVRHQ